MERPADVDQTPDIDIVLRPAWRTYWSSFLFAVILLAAAGAIYFHFYDQVPEEELVALGLVALTVFWLLYVAFKRYAWKFTIDNNRISRQYGIISRNQQSVRIQDLRSIELNQSIFQRLFGVGELYFFSAGSADSEVMFFGIHSPSRWRDKIYDVMDVAKPTSD